MRISTVALANVRRRKAKAGFLAFGIAIGIGTVVALMTLNTALKEEIGSQLDRYGANIVIVPKSNTLALDYGGISVSGVAFDERRLSNEDVLQILEIPYRKRLSVIAPKLLTSAKVEGRTVLLAGVDFDSELKLKRWWRINGHTPRAANEVLVGYDVARALSLIAGSPHANSTPSSHQHPSDADQQLQIVRQSVILEGSEHSVAGIIGQTGGPEDQMVFGPLAHVQELAGKPKELSLIEVSALCKDCPVSDIVNQIAARLPNAKPSAIQQAVRARTDTVERLTRFSAVVSMVVLAIGGLMIFTTMMGAVVERTKEIGVLRAVGFRRRHIVQQLLIEVVLISAVGGAVGWLAGLGAGTMVLPYFAESGIRIEIRAWTALASIFTAAFLGVTSTLYPALRASRLDPSEAIRYV
jgi:putative ABC transport system permease protein